MKVLINRNTIHNFISHDCQYSALFLQKSETLQIVYFFSFFTIIMASQLVGNCVIFHIAFVGPVQSGKTSFIDKWHETQTIGSAEAAAGKFHRQLLLMQQEEQQQFGNFVSQFYANDARSGC